ncbi:hypothetical protein GS415_05185 [Rhodococcus hoagii]|nr:hypothetical protein [Prescottella equi]
MTGVEAYPPAVSTVEAQRALWFAQTTRARRPPCSSRQYVDIHGPLDI